MPYRARPFKCSRCGQSVIRRAAAGAEVLCVPCAIDHQAETIRQLHDHAGPEYENWRQAYLAAAARFADPAEAGEHLEGQAAEGLRVLGRGSTPPPLLSDLHFLPQPMV